MFFAFAQTPVSSGRKLRLADVLDGIDEAFHTPFFPGNRKQMAEHDELVVDGDRTQACVQALIPIACNIRATDECQIPFCERMALPGPDPIGLLPSPFLLGVISAR